MRSLFLASILLFFTGLPIAGATELQKKGSISAKDLKEEQYPTSAKISLSEAIDVALQKQKGKAVSADLDVEDGYLVYEVTVASPSGDEFDIFVDAGNSAILGVEKDKDLIS